MANLSRRMILASGAAGGVATIAATAKAAATFGDPDQPAQGAVNASNPRALVDPGPNYPATANILPSFFNPPATDVGAIPLFWNSFNIAPRRIQDEDGHVR